MKIGIIGAGLSGIIAARELVCQGHDVELIEKSRSVGGRLATRRIGDGRADHGAVYFTVRGEELEREVQSWMNANWVRVWYADPYPRYVAIDGMNALAKRLSEDLTVQLNERVENVQVEEDGTVTVKTDVTTRSYDRVVMTAPLPQSFELLGSLVDQIKPALLRLVYSPTFVGLFKCAGDVQIGADGILDQELVPGVLKIVDNRQKGISATPLVSVYMEEAWSEAWYERPEAETLAEIERLVREEVGDLGIQSRQLKRWRYAQAKDVWHEPFYQVSHHPIYLAGDVFLEADDPSGRTRFESAYLSGLRVAETIEKNMDR
ncbi:FAD-dependent oxidoreductase [Exiguobacterium sp. BG5(2022)]|uniref:NAD(P)/FAD-dependent oxidoreductase n=1 Tax=Exiguobacterium sp. BG5(2022) TaxID=2962595 RepID=UPI0028829F8B|nr:FAD-dependent oxidoreductase [Exiguobacterium sp. BG5(2022)]MDT0192839.1 FAD-dependent oxidoreductase [Exiguobacterium sp. BG5(2022)]